MMLTGRLRPFLLGVPRQLSRNGRDGKSGLAEILRKLAPENRIRSIISRSDCLTMPIVSFTNLGQISVRCRLFLTPTYALQI